MNPASRPLSRRPCPCPHLMPSRPHGSSAPDPVSCSRHRASPLRCCCCGCFAHRSLDPPPLATRHPTRPDPDSTRPTRPDPTRLNPTRPDPTRPTASADVLFERPFVDSAAHPCQRRLGGSPHLLPREEGLEVARPTPQPQARPSLPCPALVACLAAWWLSLPFCLRHPPSVAFCCTWHWRSSNQDPWPFRLLGVCLLYTGILAK